MNKVNYTYFKSANSTLDSPSRECYWFLMQERPFFESYVMSVIRPLTLTSKEEREELIKECKFNLFKISSDKVMFDLLTDSGTGAISNKQLGAIIMGDESYAGSQSFTQMRDTIYDITGLPFVIPTHQGRGAENVLHTTLIKEGDVIPGNAHFDTTKGHIEFRKASAIDCTIEESKNPTNLHPFKGNVDLEKLEKVLQTYPASQIPFVLITATCNSHGGQPVSLANIKAVSKMCKEYEVPFFFDMARFAENAYFIKTREVEYADLSILEICREMFKDADGATMSAKKDAITAMGGFLALKSEEIYRRCSVYDILFEGYLTYGGMTGGTMAAIAQGLREATEMEYLASRVRQVEKFANHMLSANIPIIQPAGGHAIYIDASRFLPNLPASQYPAQALAVEAYIEGGIRGVEIGTVLADRDPKTGENRHPNMELLRLAIPRRTYTDNHLEYVAYVFKEIYKRREMISGLKITWEAPVLRHFTCEFSRLDN